MAVAIPEDNRDIELATALVGPSARPMGRLRFLQCGGTGRLQMQWSDGTSAAWIDIPTITADELPIHQFIPSPESAADAATD